MSEEAEEVKKLIEKSRRLKESTAVIVHMYIRLLAEIQNVQERIKKLKSLK